MAQNFTFSKVKCVHSLPRQCFVHTKKLQLPVGKVTNSNAIRSISTTATSQKPVSSVSALPFHLTNPGGFTTSHSQNRLSNELLVNPYLAQRCMVTVTKTSSSTLPSSQQVQGRGHSQEPQTDDSLSSSLAAQVSQQDNQSVIITPSAIAQIYHLATQKRPSNPSSVYLRVYVDAGGCSGFQYKFELEYDDGIGIDEEEDVVISAFIETTMSSESYNEDHDKIVVRVVIDETSLEYIRGSTIDFVREMIRSSFAVVGNPQSESACGCGSSFALKNFESNPALD